MLDWTPRQLKILDHVQTVRVATVSHRGDPFSAPVRFYFDGAVLYFTSPADSQHMVHLHANRRVAVLVDLAEDGALEGFVVQGLAEWVRGTRESREVWQAMIAKYPDQASEEAPGPMVKVEAVRVHDFG